MLLVAQYVATPFANSTSRSKTIWQGKRGLKQLEELNTDCIKAFQLPAPSSFQLVHHPGVQLHRSLRTRVSKNQSLHMDATRIPMNYIESFYYLL